MRKLIVSLVVALAVGAGAYFGVEYWASRAAIREVDAALDQWRAGTGTATRGTVEVDLWKRGVRVRDLVLTSPASPDDKVTIAEVVATGVDTSGRADRLELIGLETTAAMRGLPGARVKQAAPRIVLTGYAGRPTARRGGPTALDTMRMWLEHLSDVSAETVEIPAVTVSVAMPATVGSQTNPFSGEYTYSNVLLRRLAKGRVAEASTGKIDIASHSGARSFTGEIGGSAIIDLDLAPLLAVLDPSRPQGDGGYRRMYGSFTAGPYTQRGSDGTSFSIDRIVAEDIGVYPGKISLDDLQFLAEVGNTGGKLPTPAQLGMLIDKIGGLYEAVRLGRLELKGVRGGPQMAQVGIGSVVFRDLDKGRFAEIAIEGVKGSGPAGNETLVAGRMSFKGLYVASLLRTAATQMALLGGPRQPQDPTQMLRMLAMLEGIEIADMTMPLPAAGRMYQLQALDASWGKAVEGIPTETRITAKVRMPVGATDTDPFMRALAARGLQAVTASLDLGAAWTESTETATLAPATLETSDVAALSLKAELRNVARDVFSADIFKAIGSLQVVEAGPIELTMRDLGAVDQAAAELGRTSGAGPEAGRILLVATLAQNAMAVTQKRPELQPLFDALGLLVQRKGETVTVTLTPKGRVSLVGLIDGLRRDPLTALTDAFTVDARTGG
jgi:hypothetical protein